MSNFIVYNSDGKILRTGSCPVEMVSLQTRDGELVIDGTANDATQKVEFDGLDDEGQPINPRVVDKTPEEIETDNPTPPEIPFEKQIANVTNEQWQDVSKRIDNLEKA